MLCWPALAPGTLNVSIACTGTPPVANIEPGTETAPPDSLLEMRGWLGGGDRGTGGGGMVFWDFGVSFIQRSASSFWGRRGGVSSIGVGG
jgi:hypothetical protein